jgi:hypothetical protein
MFNKLMSDFKNEFVGKTKDEWKPISDSWYCGCITDEQLAAMRQRNEQAIEKCIEKMGTKWILHPVHKVFKNVSQ